MWLGKSKHTHVAALHSLFRSGRWPRNESVYPMLCWVKLITETKTDCRGATKSTRQADDLGNAKQTISFTQKFTFGFRNKWSAMLAINKKKRLFYFEGKTWRRFGRIILNTYFIFSRISFYRKVLFGAILSFVTGREYSSIT